VAIVFEIDDDNNEGTTFVDERRLFPVLSWSMWTPYWIEEKRRFK
jgi:hypothetical protein